MENQYIKVNLSPINLVVKPDEIHYLGGGYFVNWTVDQNKINVSKSLNHSRVSLDVEEKAKSKKGKRLGREES